MAKNNTPSKKPDLKGLSNLMGTITEKREEIIPSPLQMVVPVESAKLNDTKTESIVSEQKTDIQEETVKQKPIKNTTGKESKKTPPKEVVKKTGRPSVKSEEIPYTRLSPRIPSDLKMELDIAIARRMFSDTTGMVITTIDEFITEALKRMLKDKN